MLVEAATDDALMARVQRGDAEAFRALYVRYSAAARGVARAVIEEWASEAVQEGFAAVWSGSRRYTPGVGSVRSWILVIVRRRALDLARAEARRPVVHAARVPEPAARWSLEEESITKDEETLLRARIERLPCPQREAVVLAYFGGLTHDEIASRLELPTGTVKGRIRLAREKLRRDETVAAGRTTCWSRAPA